MLTDTLVIDSDTDDIDRGYGVKREIHAHATGVGPVHIYVTIDTYHPSAGYAYLALWTYKGWQRFAHAPGERLVVKATAHMGFEARPTQEIVDGLIAVASAMMNGETV